MAKNGRPLGATTRPQFHTYTNEIDRKAFVVWVQKNYKKNPKLATWYGDQLFGKAVQPLGNDEGKPLIVSFDNAFTQQPKGSSPK